MIEKYRMNLTFLLIFALLLCSAFFFLFFFTVIDEEYCTIIYPKEVHQYNTTVQVSHHSDTYFAWYKTTLAFSI